MTNHQLFTIDIPALARRSIGFDKLFSDFSFSKPETLGYPPYNIIKLSDTAGVIELAVAGFTIDDLDITIADGRLIVRGDTAKDDTYEYVYKGISSRAFERSFLLDEQVVIKQAEIKDGIMSVSFERIIPEEKKPVKIDISVAQ